MKWHDEDAVGYKVPAQLGLEIPEQTQSLALSSPICWAWLEAALQARTASALWSTNCKGQLSASSTQQSQHLTFSRATLI